MHTFKLTKAVTTKNLHFEARIFQVCKCSNTTVHPNNAPWDARTSSVGIKLSYKNHNDTDFNLVNVILSMTPYHGCSKEKQERVCLIYLRS